MLTPPLHGFSAIWLPRLPRGEWHSAQRIFSSARESPGCTRGVSPVAPLNGVCLGSPILRTYASAADGLNALPSFFSAQLSLHPSPTPPQPHCQTPPPASRIPRRPSGTTPCRPRTPATPHFLLPAILPRRPHHLAVTGTFPTHAPPHT